MAKAHAIDGVDAAHALAVQLEDLRPLENKMAGRTNAPGVGANCAASTRKTQEGTIVAAEKAAKHPGGRPPLPPEKKRKPMTVSFTSAQLDAIDKAMGVLGVAKRPTLVERLVVAELQRLGHLPKDIQDLAQE